MKEGRKKFIFVGCSLTYGEGLDEGKDDVNNYANIVGNYFNANIINLAVSGNNNHNIFLSGLEALLTNTPDILFVQWSGLHRMDFCATPDLSKSLKITSSRVNDFHIEYINSIHDNIFKDKKEVELFYKQLMLLNKDVGQIAKLIKYVKILENLSSRLDVKLVFINGLLYWTEDLLNPTIKNYNKDLSHYTKSLVEFKSRNDDEIGIFFNDLATRMQDIDKSLWVNMFSNLFSLKVDIGNDNAHPGPESHKKYARNVINHLSK